MAQSVPYLPQFIFPCSSSACCSSSSSSSFEQEALSRKVKFLIDPFPSEAVAASFGVFVVVLEAVFELNTSRSLPWIIAYVLRLRQEMNCCSSCYILAGIYVRRFFERKRKVLQTRHVNSSPLDQRLLQNFELRRLCVIALTVAAKYFDDMFHTNNHYAHVGGLCCSEFNILEQRFLNILQYELYVSGDDFSHQLHLQNMVLLRYYRVDKIQRPLRPSQQSSCLLEPRSSATLDPPSQDLNTSSLSCFNPGSQHCYSSKLVQFIVVPVTTTTVAGKERPSNFCVSVNLNTKV